jgi:formate dehydrogenase iron-sulfur subunit
MMPKQKGMLIDTTLCIGCRGCQVACKQWNQLPAETTDFSATMTSPSALSATTWTHIDFSEIAATADRPAWDFVKRQCMHCDDPACVAVCPVGAFRRTKTGAVVHEEEKCMGCRYCMLACPYDIPKFEWAKTEPLIKKCTLCYDRIAADVPPICSLTCPTGATKSGDRESLLAEAKRRLKARPETYIPKIYGNEEAGGSAVLYLSDVPFEKLGLRSDLGVMPLPAYTWQWLKKVPGIAVGTTVALAGLWQITKRRDELEKSGAQDQKRKPTPVDDSTGETRSLEKGKEEEGEK